jgi:hypothetical protein
MYVSAILSDNQIEAGYSVDSNAALGPRSVAMTTSGGTSGGLMFNVTAPATVNVSYASVPNDRITVELAPAGLSGTLTVQLVGATTHTVYQGTKSAGTHDISFNIPNLPTAEFTEVRATWTAGGQAPYSTYGHHFKVLGDYSNTRYNTPTESFCSGSPVTVEYVTGSCASADNCTFTAFQGKSQWWNEVYQNGSGFSQSAGIGTVSREWFCSGPERKVRRVPAPCSQCGSTLVVGATVARNVNNADLPCGAELYVHQVGIVTVADAGGGLSMTQLDHYAGFTGCDQNAGSIGTRKVIRLY